MNAPIHTLAAMRHVRLNATQAEVLARIAHASATMGDLAAILGISPTAMTHVAGYLEERGLARRVGSPHNRRVQNLTIRPPGREIVAGFSCPVAETVVKPEAVTV